MEQLTTSSTTGVDPAANPLAVESLPASASRVEVPLHSAAEEVSQGLLKTEKSYRVAVAQIRTLPGHIEENTRRIVEKITEARRQGAQLIVFPEATVPAYCSMDLQYNKNYIRDNLKALEKIKDASEGITVIVGFVDVDTTHSRPGHRPDLYNSAAVIRDGKILAVQDKSLLPTYDIFFEDRYYSPSRGNAVVDLGDVRIGTTICEDIWAKAEQYPTNPTSQLVEAGANVIVNLSASPFHLGKHGTRSEIVQQTAAEHGVPCIYANLIGSYDGYDGEVVFDGRSIVASPTGQVIGAGKAFQEDLFVVDIFHAQELTLPDMPEIEELYEALVLGIKDYMHRSGSAGNRAIIGLSGGIDSALVAALAVDALGPDRVLGITMPSQFNSAETKGAAYELARNLGIQIKTVPIQEQVDAALGTLTEDPDMAQFPPDVAEENVQARMRMINLMYYANKMQGIVLNTGNKTELALNNMTIYGDMVGGFSVLGDVDKDRVYELSRYINERHGHEVIPIFSIETPASAELAPNQFDSDVMGDRPEILAPMVRDIIEHNLTLDEIQERYGRQFSNEQIDRVLSRIEFSEWKRRQASPGIRVTPHAFGHGRKMPMSHGYRR